MSPRRLLLDVRHVRASAPPLLALGLLAFVRAVCAECSLPAAVDQFVLMAWRTSIIGTLLWFLSAVLWAVLRPRRDRRAFRRLQRLREMATSPDRALVHVQTSVWSSVAGQHVAVVNVATGVTTRLWLPETTVPAGSFVVLERTNAGVRVVDWMNAHEVKAGQCHQRRHAVRPITADQASVQLFEQEIHDDALQLIEETERFLRE